MFVVKNIENSIYCDVCIYTIKICLTFFITLNEPNKFVLYNRKFRLNFLP